MDFSSSDCVLMILMGLLRYLGFSGLVIRIVSKLHLRSFNTEHNVRIKME